MCLAETLIVFSGAISSMMADNVSENVLYVLFVSIVFRLSQFVVFILSAVNLIFLI